MIDRVYIVAIQIDLEHSTTDPGNCPTFWYMKLDSRIRIESTDDVGPDLATLQGSNQFYAAIIIRHSHPLDREPRVGTQTSRRVIWPVDDSLRVCTSDDDISLPDIIGLRSHHIYSELSSGDRCGSFFYGEIWTDRIVRVDRTIVAIGRHTERDDKNRGEDRKE